MGRVVVVVEVEVEVVVEAAVVEEAEPVVAVLSPASVTPSITARARKSMGSLDPIRET